MAIRIVRLGTERVPSEGLRIGTVRRPPRGVPKSKFSSGNWYDVWFPNLAPSPQAVKIVLVSRTNPPRGDFLSGAWAAEARPEKTPGHAGLVALFNLGKFFGGVVWQ